MMTDQPTDALEIADPPDFVAVLLPTDDCIDVSLPDLMLDAYRLKRTLESRRD